MPRPLRLLAVCLAALAGGALHAAETPPRWPLDLPERYLTSNFMESRPGRFHAGVDLKTRSETGFPARAAVDGWISRIRFSANGYGKAVYLNGNDGRIYVYAHLERLADPLRAMVRETQRRRGRYDVSLFFPKGRHPVRRGEVLALTGQSGTAGPHLHFEVRDASNRPLDPLAHGFAVADTIPPRLLRLRIHPAAPGSRVDGRDVACAVGDGRIPLPARLPDVAVSGPIALSLRLVEETDAAGHRLAPWRLSVTLDDSLVYDSRNERLEFARNDRARLEWLATDEGLERWLHRHPDVDLAGRDGAAWSLDPTLLTPGPHEVRVTAEDRAGNSAAAAWRLLVDADPVGAWAEAPVRARAEDPVEGVAWLDPFRAELHGAVVPLDSLAALLGRPVAAVHRPLAVDAAERARLQRTQGLTVLDWGREVLAAVWPRRAELDLAPAWPDSLPPDAGVYVAKGDQWRYHGPVQRRDGAWRLPVDGPGRYLLCRDLQAPYLGPGPEEGRVDPGPAGVADAVTPSRWQVLPIRLEDLGSGVDPATLEATWNGEPFWPEPDMPRRRVLVEPPDDAAPGRHVLMLRARDRAGNEAERTYTLHLESEESFSTP